jgi:hypothetical protein
MELITARKAFAALAGGTFVGMDTETVPALKGGKKNPQQGRVTNRMVGATVMCFANASGSAYEAMVKRRLVAEGRAAEDFQIGPRAWGTREVGAPFVEHRGNHYLEVIFLHSGKTQFFLDGVAIAREDVEGLEEQRDGTGQGGLENKVVIRTFALDSVIALRANGQEWR